jgi:hypothetical protein
MALKYRGVAHIGKGVAEGRTGELEAAGITNR